jgi:hypothetical protein
MKQTTLSPLPIPQKLKDRFLRACGIHGRSMADVQRQLIVEFVEREEKKK